MLSPTTQSPTSHGFSWLSRWTRDKTRYVGIDVGIDHVKIATFGSDSDTAPSADGKPAIGWLSRSEFALPVDPHAPPQPDWVDVVAECLSDRLPRCVDGDRNVAVAALPIPWVHYQTTPESEIASAQSQCDSMFTGSIFQSSAHLSKWPVVEGKEYVIAATAESAACRIAESINGVGFHVDAILPHGVALLQAAPALTSLKPSAVLLLEPSGGMVALRNENSCGLCRNLPACDGPISEQPYLDELQPWLQEIAMEVNATSRYVARMSGTVDRESTVLICGRAAELNGVDSAMASMLGRPVAVWKYAGRTRPRRISSSVESDSSMAVSLSLACCGIQSSSATGRSER